MLKGPKDVQVGLQGKMFLNWLKKLESSRVHVYCTSHLMFILVFIHMTLGSTLVPHSRWSPGLNMPIVAGVLKRFFLFHEMSTLLLLGGLCGFTERNIQLINKSNICWTNKIRRWFFLFNSFFFIRLNSWKGRISLLWQPPELFQRPWICCYQMWKTWVFSHKYKCKYWADVC